MSTFAEDLELELRRANVRIASRQPRDDCYYYDLSRTHEPDGWRGYNLIVKYELADAHVPDGFTAPDVQRILGDLLTAPLDSKRLSA